MCQHSHTNAFPVENVSECWELEETLQTFPTHEAAVLSVNAESTEQMELKALPGRSTVSSLFHWSQSYAVSVWPQLQPERHWNWSWPDEKTWSTGTEPPGRTNGTRPRSWPGKRRKEGGGKSSCQKRRPRLTWWLNWGESDQTPPVSLHLLP